MKNKKILLLILFVLILLTGCGKGTVKNERLDIPDSISFSQLEKLAIEPQYVKQKNYIVSGELFNLDSNTSYVQCLGSSLGVTYENSKYVLKNLSSQKVICSDVYNIGFYDYNGYFQGYNNVHAYNQLPVAIYCTYNSSSSQITINYVDPYGTTLKTEVLPSGNYKYISTISTKKVGDYDYFSIQQADGYSENLYFRYKYENKKYVVEEISQAEFTNATGDSLEYEYKDELVECYDSKGRIFAYYYYNSNSLFLYDEDKHYLNNVNLASFGFDSSLFLLRLEKKMYYFKNEAYYESQMTRGSNPTYKCRCLEIDLTTGKVYYNDDFKYYVLEAVDRTTNNTFQYGYVTYYEVLDNRELSKIKKCVILKDKLSFKDAFVYDGFTTNIYKVDDNSLLVNFNSGLYLVTKTERTRINGITNILYFENGNIMYLNKDNKYYTCKLSNILESVKSFDGGYTYLSTDTYNGKTTSYNYDSNTKKYMANGLELNPSFATFARQCIYVTDNCVYVDENKIIDGGTLSITQFSSYASIGDATIYRVRFSNGSYKYLKYSYVVEQ